jgi:dephospho-CoA kinase
MDLDKMKIESINNKKYVLGVTGLMAAGKSHVCKKLIEIGRKNNFNMNYIEFDEIRRAFKDKSVDEVKKRIENYQGLTLFEWAMIVEDGFLNMIDDALIIYCKKENHMKRLDRIIDISQDEKNRRLGNQLNNEIKLQRLIDYGFNPILFENNEGIDEKSYDKLLENIIDRIKLKNEIFV